MTKIIILALSAFIFAAPVNSTEDQTFQEQVECMARNIYHEARGESHRGMLAVAHVTMNRVLSGRFPNTVCAVVYQPKQFSWTSRKGHTKTVPDQFYELAERVIMNPVDTITNGALYFHNTSISAKRPVKARIGNHIFY